MAFSAGQASLRAAFLRQIDQTETKALRGTELTVSVFFSSDSATLGVTGSDGTLKKVSLKDGLRSVSGSRWTYHALVVSVKWWKSLSASSSGT